jgi:hypothetical protein
MFFAAFSSRSWETPQAGHAQRFAQPSVACTVPHAKQRLLLGKNRSISITCRPAHSAL